MNDFYVYHHVRTSDGKVFYVGKGRGSRLKAVSGRNPKWANFVAKHGGWVAKIIADGMNEREAHALEIAEIARLGKKNLCNLTGGGEGVCGLKFTDDQRLKLSEVHIGLQAGEKHPLYGSTRPKDTREKISQSLKGNRNRGSKPMADASKAVISAALTGMFAGDRHHKYDATVRKFYHPSIGEFIGTTFDLRMKYDLEQGNISAVVRGKRNHHRGWTHIGIYKS